MKAQLGVRVDRLLYRDFVRVCNLEKLRPGEAMEALLRTAVAAGGISSLASQSHRSDPRLAGINETLFRVKLHELEESTKSNVRLHAEDLDIDLINDDRVNQILELSKNIDNSKLLEEFEKILASSLSHKHDKERAG